MSVIFGILAGIGVPIQTSINARLRKKVGSPYRASLVSFAVSLIFLVLLLLILGQGVHLIKCCRSQSGFGLVESVVLYMLLEIFYCLQNWAERLRLYCRFWGRFWWGW